LPELPSAELGGADVAYHITYQQVRPWARAIKERTALRDKRGVMPPWFIEKNIGIQHYKNDPSLSDLEIAKIAKWADSGAPEGNPADMPPPRPLIDGTKWNLGEPDLVVSTEEILEPSVCIGAYPLERSWYQSAIVVRLQVLPQGLYPYSTVCEA
jgi:hypothetical protein